MFKHVVAMTLGSEKNEYLRMMKEKDYISVGQKYGRLVYCISVSGFQRRRLWKKLAKESRLDVIQQIYSKRILKKARVLQRQYMEYTTEPNRVKAAFIYGIRRIIRSKLLWTTLVMYLLWTPMVMTFIKGSTFNEQQAVEAEYAEEIKAFDQKAAEYSVYLFFDAFDAQEPDDLQICNKIMYDMWSNIKGYGNPEINKTGFLRLDIVNGDGVGVCRNMADYMVSVLNSQVMDTIRNPRKMYVDMGHGESYLLEMPRNILTTSEDLSERANSYEESKFLKKYAANHVIVAVDVNDYAEDISFTLLIDPTNPSYGYLKNGKIVWINSEYDRYGNSGNSNPAIYTYKKRADYELGDNHLQNSLAILKSYSVDDRTEEYILSHYGVTNQQVALETIKLIDDNEYVGETFFHGAISEVLGN